jgi:hypothetical protein
MAEVKLRDVWRQMLKRCHNPRDKYWHRYGGRGITVCERWLVFENFFADVGPRPTESYSIDRIDNDGNYEPGNVRWATSSEQARNSCTTVNVTMNGKTKCILEWSQELGIKASTLYARFAKYGSLEVPPDKIPRRKVGPQKQRGFCKHGHKLREDNICVTCLTSRPRVSGRFISHKWGEETSSRYIGDRWTKE